MKKYDSLNGIRTIACICIVFMHILANSTYNLNSTLTSVIESFTNFVFIFMVLSAFSMCCGYYEKIKDNHISPEEFYKRRITKTLPFFLFLVLIDIAINHNRISLIEGFADSTLLFGFIPKELTVIGVGWFIGLIFIFYLMFPFFVYLFSNKKRAWATTIIALMMNLSSIYYFNIGRTNMFYSFIYFCIGGLLYLYKDIIVKLFKKYRIISTLLLLGTFILFILLKTNKYTLIIPVLLLSCISISYAISFDSKALNNKLTAFIGTISLEIYLSHMLVFRVLEKIKLTAVINNDYLSYLLIIVLVLIGTIIFAQLFHIGMNIIEKKVKINENTIS